MNQQPPLMVFLVLQTAKILVMQGASKREESHNRAIKRHKLLTEYYRQNN